LRKSTLLIAPEGIEINFDLTVLSRAELLLIAPEGIEMGDWAANSAEIANF